MIIPKECWKRKIGEPLENPGKTKIIGFESGLPNFDDGYFNGMPLGGFGTGTFSHTFRGDFTRWHMDIGKHNYKTLFPCQFGIYENGKASILNDYKPEDGSLSSWNFSKPNGTYHALYPRAYFEYSDLNLILEEYSPIIPDNYQETSFPVAVFKWHISNPTKKDRELSILFSFQSIFGSKQNIFCQENAFSGLVFDNLHGEKNYKYGQMGIFVQNEDVQMSYLNAFNENGDGKEVWDTFSTNGTLADNQIKESNYSLLTNSPGAICAKVHLDPGEKKTITFVLAWDYPILDTVYKTKWYKHYTKFFGKDGRSVTKIARKAFNNNERWLLEILKWQDKYLKMNKPDWFKTFLINELYYIADGGTIWTAGKVPPEKQDSSSVKGSHLFKQEEHFGTLECFDYPFYETLDVRFYGSFPLIKLWPNIEKVILNDYIKTVFIEDLEKKFFNHPLDQSTAERKLRGAVPHDLGAPFEDPFIKINSYMHVNINKWKDLNSKFVLLIYRYFYFTGKKDLDFLEKSWDSVELAINYLKNFDRDNDGLIENDNIPDQTYDNWTMHGPSTYCNGLWLASLKATIEMAKVLGKDPQKYKDWFKRGKESLEQKLWTGEYYFYDTLSPHKENIMADQLCGQWYADLLELGDIFNRENIRPVLKKIFDFNVMKVGDGKIGAINGINPNGSLLPESTIWKANTQSNEIWTGVTLALASYMDLIGLKDEALKTAYGIYHVTYEKKGYWFRTPEAWDINGDFRASMYHRPGSIWAFDLE